MIVQVPSATFVTNIPDTVQTLLVEDENETTNFEEAAADLYVVASRAEKHLHRSHGRRLG